MYHVPNNIGVYLFVAVQEERGPRKSTRLKKALSKCKRTKSDRSVKDNHFSKHSTKGSNTNALTSPYGKLYNICHTFSKLYCLYVLS